MDTRTTQHATTPVLLAPEVGRVVRDFGQRHGAALADPADVYERCQEISNWFTAHCLHARVPARTISGCKLGTDPYFGGEVILAGHFATLIPARRDPADGAWVGLVVVDWTAHQFDPTVAVPGIALLEQWRGVWRSIGADTAQECW